MADCKIQPLLERFLDGELDADGRATVERHLSECANCVRELNELRGVSTLFATAAQPAFLPIMRHRLHQRVELAMERGLLRIAWMLSGVAASVLIAGSAWLMMGTTGRQTPEAAAPPWVAVAAASDTTATSATPAAEWYLADASSSRSDEP